MNELVKIQNLNINHSISEGLEILFFHILQETKSKYGFYMLRYPPDKEWLIPELYFDTHETKMLSYSMILHSNTISSDSKERIINKYHIAKNISSTDESKSSSTDGSKPPFINDKLNDIHLKCFTIPEVLLHPNIQIVLVLINYNENYTEDLLKPTLDKYIPLLCVQFLKKYIDNVINESNISLVRTIGKMKSPINEIISIGDKINKDIKKPALSLAMIINDLVDIYKLKRNRLKLVRTESKIRTIFQELTDIIEFNYIIDEDVPDILYVDSKRLKQVLLNFITNNSFVYVSASMVIDINNNDDEILCWSLEFNIENAESVIDERLFISKKLVALMGGYLINENDMNDQHSSKFTIEACRDMNSYSDNSLKKIKGKRILIIDNHEERRIDIGHRLQKWEMDIIFASTESEGSLFLDETKNKIDLFIVGIPTFIDKILRFNIHKPYLQILDFTDQKDPPSKNEYLTVKDVTPINSPRARKSSITKPLFLPYPIEGMKLLSIIIEILN